MIIDGKAIAEEILSAVKKEISGLPFRPVFCDVLVGGDAVSKSYVRIKGRKALEAGMEFLPAYFPATVSQAELMVEIGKLGRTPNLCGLVVQLPLPAGLEENAVLDAVNPEVDVDCMCRANQDKFYSGDSTGLVMPTAGAIAEIFRRLEVKPGKKVIVVGQGRLVGRPAAHLLAGLGFEVATADRSTGDLKHACLAADIVVSAAGIPKLINGEMIRPGSIVIDAGTSESNAGIVGDVDWSSVAKVARLVTPVPGGVGPVTVAVLLSNVLAAAKQKLKNNSWKPSA